MIITYYPFIKNIISNLYLSKSTNSIYYSYILSKLDHSLQHFWVGLRQMHDHFTKERVGPSEPVPCNFCGIIHRKRLVHEVIFGGLHQTLKAVSDFIIGFRCQDLYGESQRPDVPWVRMRTSNSIYLSSCVEVFILLGKDELSGV